MMRYLIVSLFVTTLAFAQAGRIQGTVESEEGPTPGVNILVMDTPYGAVTNVDGSYLLSGIPEGSYRIRFSSVGYKTHFEDVRIVADKTVELDVTIVPDVINLDEVEVVANEMRDASDTKTSVIDLDPKRAKMLPGAAEDVLRTLQSLPGVLAPNDFSSQLVIRGSGPDQNLIIIDNVEIFNPYRLYGAISMFNPDAVEEIDLITGGFPAKYGDRLSAVLDVTNREGDRKEDIAGSLNASIVSANLVLEGQNPLDIKGSWMFNTRRTYYDLIIEPFAKGAGLVEDNVTFPNFYDIQSKLTFGPFNGHKIILTGIYSADGVDVVSGEERNSPDSVSVNNITRNDVLSASWHWAPSKNVLNQSIFSVYRNSGITGFDSEVLDPSLNRERFEEFESDTLSPYLVNLKFDSDFSFLKYSYDNKFTWLWGNKNTFEAGFGVDLMSATLRFDFEIDEQIRAIVDNNPNARSALEDLDDVQDYARYRVYAQNKFNIDDVFFIHPGLRLDHYNILGKSYVSPRIQLSYALNEVTTLRAAWGLYYQSPGYEKLRDASLLYDLSPEFTENLEAEQAVHYVLGIERWLSNEWKFRLEGYYKDFADLIVPKKVTGTAYFTEPIPGKNPRLASAWTRPVPFAADSITQIPINNSYGEAYGLEVMIAKENRQRESKLSGWISYALAWAHRFEDGRELPFRFDQRHTLNIVLDYQVDDIWSVGMRFQYGSGYPYTEAAGVAPRIIMTDTNGDLVPDSPTIATRQSISDPNSREVIYNVDFEDGVKYNSRKPEYHRLDIRVSALAEIFNRPWTFYLDVINVYNRGNVVGYDYYVEDNLTLGSEKNTMFPIVPTLGFSVRF